MKSHYTKCIFFIIHTHKVLEEKALYGQEHINLRKTKAITVTGLHMFKACLRNLVILKISSI